MKFVSEYRDADIVKKMLDKIHSIAKNSWRIMEICGGQTHAFLRYGIDQLLPQSITLLHGPGCPVCVTPLEKIDKAITIASFENVILCTFGDMVRVPGSTRDLLSVKAAGGNIRIVYSPVDALKIAGKNPEKQVVFFAVGFETTAPAHAMTILQAEKKRIAEGLNNFFVLSSQVLVPPAIRALLDEPSNKIDGFLAAGHVCTVMGYDEYIPIAEKYKVPIVITGFEPLDLTQGIYLCLKQLEEGRAVVENQYGRSVSQKGNFFAQQAMKEVFTIVNRKWRGIGEIPKSGLDLADKYSHFDAEKKFKLTGIRVEESQDCIAGQILQGLKKPTECPQFANSCTPEHPKGATMVSSEGACAAYYKYRNRDV